MLPFLIVQNLDYFESYFEIVTVNCTQRDRSWYENNRDSTNPLLIINFGISVTRYLDNRDILTFPLALSILIIPRRSYIDASITQLLI